MTATNFLYRLSSFPWLLIVVVVVILLSADMFSGDVQGGAYKVLYSQPLQRSKVYAVKYLLNLGGGILLASLLIALVFGGLSLINETGSTSYPVFYMEESYRSLTIGAATDEILPLISWSTYMLRVLPLYLMLCCFTIVLTGTISLFMNSTANALSVSVCLLFLDYSFRTLLPGDKVFYFIWPLTPLSPNDVLMGYYSPSALSYLILLGALTVLLAAVGLLVLNKRDLKGGAA